MLWDIRENHFSPAFCGLFRIPEALLPEVCDCALEAGPAV
jgi:sugar (pentulose or hexulose) kinase